MCLVYFATPLLYLCRHQPLCLHALCFRRPLPHVLPALKNTVRGLQSGRVQCPAWRQALIDRVRRNNAKAAVTKIKAGEGSSKTERTKAMQYARALDATLVDAGLGLKVFKKRNTCKPLERGEVRYKTERKRPAPYAVPEGVAQKRSCVKKRRLRKPRSS